LAGDPHTLKAAGIRVSFIGAAPAQSNGAELGAPAIESHRAGVMHWLKAYA
jgi:hypothetical protein